MVNARLRSFRRNELIEATIAAISKGGLQDTTLATIGRHAGLSPALVNHYFDGKEALLEATMRRLMRNLGEDIARRLPAARPPPCRHRRLLLAPAFPARFDGGLAHLLARGAPRSALRPAAAGAQPALRIQHHVRAAPARRRASGGGHLPRPDGPDRWLLVGLRPRCQADPARPRAAALPGVSR